MATPPVKQFVNVSPPPNFSSFADVTQWCRSLYNTLWAMKRGKLECVTQLTMASGTTTTVLTDSRLSLQSVVVLDPMTAHAASLLHTSPGVYTLEANRGNGSWTFTHANTANNDQKFAIAIIG